ncbi:MAG: hypothetical protein ACOVQ6_19870 [Brevundimonas sp.]
MADKKNMDRRSFLGRVVGAAAMGGALSAVTGPMQAVAQSGCTDSDTGNYRDTSGNGRRCATQSGCTDSDTGTYGDGIGRGRRCG